VTVKSEAIACAKEMPVILLNRVVEKKILIGKMKGRGGEARGIIDPLKYGKPTYMRRICYIGHNTTEKIPAAHLVPAEAVLHEGLHVLLGELVGG
jgi:hypothetical protein